MKEKLRELNIRLTELSNYLNISRPTLYKYIDDFEKKRMSKIDYEVIQLFKFISKKTTLSKLQVIDYIVNKKDQNTDFYTKIKKVVNTPEKEELLTKMLDVFDKDSYKELINKFLKNIKENDK